MASCSMASAAIGFMVSPNVTSNTSTVKCSMVMFSSKNKRCSRLVVRAEEQPAAPAAAEAEKPAAAEAEVPKKEAAPKPPPIGPKRGAKVNGVYIS